MKQIWTLYRYEWKKIVKRRLVWICMAISAVMIAATVGGTVLDILYEDDGETETMYQAFQKDKAYQKALEGKIIDQELLEETMAAYGTIPKDVERYSQTEEYEAYARPYSAIFQYIRIATDMVTKEARQWEADERELYDMHLEMLMREADSCRLSQDEKDFWLAQEERKTWPVEFRYKEGYWRLLDCGYTIGLLAIVVTAICLSGVFVEEHVRRTDQLILSSRHGRQKAFWAKFLAGLTFALALSILFSGLSFLIAFGIYGAEGFTADFQLVSGGFFPPLNVGGAVLLYYACMGIAVVFVAAFVMALSELLRSSIGTLSFVVGVVILGIFVNVPAHLRILAQAWSYLPSNFIANWNVFNARLVGLFGKFLMPWQAVPMLYVILGIGLAFLGRRAFMRYQVTGGVGDV